VIAHGGAGDEEVGVIGQTADREVRLDPAASIQELRVHDGADRTVDPVRAHPLEERRCARPVHFELRKRRLIE
jgi:hypothetical protein